MHLTVKTHLESVEFMEKSYMEIAKKHYKEWCEMIHDDSMKSELESISQNDAEICDRFYKDIEFGTAGLRGITGAGTNRLNLLTVGRVTAGLAKFINKKKNASGKKISDEKVSGDNTSGGDASVRNYSCKNLTGGVVIAYDCRYHSREFSEFAAEILMAAGIHVFIFPEMRPTPELSFAIRNLKAVSGINMTASHNPKEYNGYKVYWNDGAQISGDISDGIACEISKLSLFDDIPRMTFDEGKDRGLLHMLGEETDRKYLDYVKAQQLYSDEELDKSVSVVYTPLNGAGSISMQRIAAERGFSGFHIVEEQKDPDPEFSTVGYPNPEDKKAFRLAEELGKKFNADILIATDPDSDRMAVEISDGKEGFIALNGNQTGALLIMYKAEAMSAVCMPNGGDKLSSGDFLHKINFRKEKYALIKSIVTGDMGRKIADKYGIYTFEALTGFKNICGKINMLQDAGFSYFFGYEESIGCAPSDGVRDKDGIAAGSLIMEMAAYYKKRGIKMRDVLKKLYDEYGYFAEKQVSLVKNGIEGATEIKKIMNKFRNSVLSSFGEEKVTECVDYISGYKEGLDYIARSDVLKYTMGKDTWFAVRPSGTEPKIKFYFYTCKNSREDAEEEIRILSENVMAFAENS